MTSVTSPNSRACVSPFWPVVASMTSSVSVTRPAPFSATRRTLASSSIRLLLVCNRPAVSAITRSMCFAAAFSTPSNTTELGSAPSAPRTISTSLRSAQVVSCSAAAARNVSPAASSTERPASTCCLVSLPIVVVLPTPLTPTNIHTLGAPSPSASKLSDRSAPARRACISASSASSSSLGSVISLFATLARRPSRSSSEMPTPMSARSSASSSSSNDSSVMPERPSTPAMAPVKAERAFASRSRSVPGDRLDDDFGDRLGLDDERRTRCIVAAGRHRRPRGCDAAAAAPERSRVAD